MPRLYQHVAIWGSHVNLAVSDRISISRMHSRQPAGSRQYLWQSAGTEPDVQHYKDGCWQVYWKAPD